jgi:SAM-dependent methyltransferase
VSHQWWTTLYPRLQGYVPAERILEIAPGYGRWTHFLKELCGEIVIVDLAESAIAYCNERFAADRHVSAHVNDGTSLPMAADASIDLVFSFDSLVHVERDVIQSYLAEIARILTPDGVAFLHHSNLAAHDPAVYTEKNKGWRATSVSGAVVESLGVERGLSAVSQEQISWGGVDYLNDCISVITRAGSRWDRENVVVENPDFSKVEIAMAVQRSTLYPPSSPDVTFAALKLSAAGS